jgi:hypothetical protein
MRVIHRIIHARQNHARAATAPQRAATAAQRGAAVGRVHSRVLITGRTPATVQPAQH